MPGKWKKRNGKNYERKESLNSATKLNSRIKIIKFNYAEMLGFVIRFKSYFPNRLVENITLLKIIFAFRRRRYSQITKKYNKFGRAQKIVNIFCQPEKIFIKFKVVFPPLIIIIIYIQLFYSHRNDTTAIRWKLKIFPNRKNILRT